MTKSRLRLANNNGIARLRPILVIAALVRDELITGKILSGPCPGLWLAEAASTFHVSTDYHTQDDVGCNKGRHT